MVFLGLLLYTTFIYIRPQEWMAAFIGSPVMNVIGIVTSVFWLIELLTRKRKIINTPQDSCMILFCLFLVFSHVVWFYFGGAWQAFIDFSKIVLIYLVVSTTVNNIKKFDIFASLLIILTFVLCFQGALQAKTGIGMGGVTPIESRIRALGIFNDPNDLALAIVVMVPFVLNILFSRKRLLLKFVSFIVILFYLYGIYLTNSRGGILALMVVVAVFFVGKSKKFLWGAITSCVLIMLIFSYGPSRLALLSSEEVSAYQRIDSWYQGFQMLIGSPFLGVGYGMFLSHHFQTAHNSFILVAAETGFLGYFTWIAIFYFVIKSSVAIERVSEELAERSFVLRTGIIGFVAASLFLSRAYVLLPYLLLGMVTGLVSASRGVNPKLSVSAVPKDYLNILVIGIIVLTGIYMLMKVAI
ncbi:MAG: O-Antigen ligase [Pelotomaculum sp. PtaU1.Bin065]|nr:MAG: O-Antigen ligase [Pelotomaculum sp. PtaU1.Bin065]